MFFIMGISSGQKKLEFVQTIFCSKCSQFGRLELYITYTSFTLFFIPIFKWNKKYYAKAACCGALYTIEAEIGKKIANKETITLTEQDLHLINNPNSYTNDNPCPNCGYALYPDYSYCPKCGFRL
ncbi:zinc ribbon domain-containing protein [Anaerocolumna sp. MB42-C2]|uniref:zinc ribbon domain-containing protein n=1 Tax=Anaerocolumna sp. MB42-C2 TaxID=3070997 RepID=UPI0027E10B5F|nr:zinc ribbon domain-containing protein [Anaerocolumna sp. MB42-C2]WMJ88493.1 zinc ribbon domain-containing protein [Anaerocolumna sp. MB42-C2]